MLRAQEGLQGCLLVAGGMDKVAGKAKWMQAEVYLGGGQGILAEAYLGGVQGILAGAYLKGVQGLEPENAWWAARKSAPAWCAVGSYELPTQSRQQPHGKERRGRAQRCHE